MPALPNKQPVAARQNRISTSPTRKDSYSTTTSMSTHNNIDKGGRQGASANFTSTRNPNSMYNAMSMVLGKELEQKAVEETKSKKAAQPIPRPLTPHGKGKNFIERNKQSVQAFPVSPVKPTHKKSKEEPQSVSPTPTLKKSAVNPTTPNRPVTPGANGQSSARPQAKPEKKTKAASNRRPVSPPASSAHSAHSRSHESAHHSAHSRSHVRAASPEISLREENKKLRRLLMERDDWLREKEAELLDAEDIVEAFQERVRQVEARNRELQKENELMRGYIEEELEKKKSSATEPTSIISSVMSNIQRIRGEPVSPISKPDSPTLDSKPVSPIPIVSPKSSPLLTTKSKELMKANVKVKTPVSPPLQPRVVPKTRGNLIPANKVNDVQTPRGNDLHPPRPTAPSPAAMNRHEPSSFNNGGLKRTEMSDRHAEMSRDRQASDRKKAAALNVVMEESEDSEVDEFIFERDETSDDQADSEFDTTGTESENDDEYTSSGNTNVNDTENESDDDFDKWSTHASSKHTLNSIIEDEEEEEEDDEFDYEPQQQTRQQQKNWTPVNPIEPSNATVAQVASAGTASSQANLSGIQKSDNSNNNKRLRRRLLNSIGSDSSDSGIGSAHEEHFDDNVLNSNNGQQISTVNNNVSTQKQMAKQHDNFSHRDSMSSIKSDSSDDSIISASSSHNDSYPSSVTSPSSADISPYGSFAQSSIKSVNSKQNLASSNGLYGQSTSNSDLSSSKMMSSGFACNPLSQLNNNGLNSSSNKNGMTKINTTNLNDNNSTSSVSPISTSQSDNSADYFSHNHHNHQSNNKFVNPHNSGISSVNSALNSNKLDINSTSVSKSSSSGLDSNDSTPVTRLPSPTFATTARLSGSSVNNVINSKRSISPNSANSTKNVSKQSNPRSTSPSTVSNRSSSPASSSRASTPSSNASTARAPSPASPSSSRASTPASESSRNASSGSNRRSRLNSTANSSSDKCQTAIPPPPPPPTNKDPFATLQHYLRLISENSVMENPLKSYDVNKVIDEGSSAKVYTANPLSNPSEECAIKVVPLSYSLEFIFNEIYVLKNLKHKNIVDFKESFLRWDGKTREVWIAMEKCARGDVTNRAGKVNQREVGRIAGELLSALKHLHANGIIHRDIKLSNILAGANNEIKLADFGISSLTPTSTTSMVGTIPYMAPDVVLVGPDRPYDTKVDIWSLGVCILELLTGKAAWGRIRDDEIMDKLRRGEMPYGFQRLRKKADIGWEAVDFLEKCFARTPENRWSAEKLLEHPFITGNRN